MSARQAAQGRPVFQAAGKQVAWWGLMGFILTEALFFALLLATYFYIRGASANWPLGDISKPELVLPSIATVILLASSVPMVFATRAEKEARTARFVWSLVIAFALGAVFVVLQLYELWNLEFAADTNAYGSLFWVITSFHLAHLSVGMLMVLYLLARIWANRLPAGRNAATDVVGWYWHFVDAVWIFVYLTIHISPYVLTGK